MYIRLHKVFPGILQVIISNDMVLVVSSFKRQLYFLVLGLLGHHAESSTFRQNQAFPCRRIEGFRWFRFGLKILESRTERAKAPTARFLEESQEFPRSSLHDSHSNPKSPSGNSGISLEKYKLPKVIP